ncbi:MAG: hypothetical protein E6713_08285 [Sporomusaceae bacterium]|nr:hypothetical protein [Sporomusaceae bacterium]
MKAVRILNSSAYEETLKNLSNYHKSIIYEIGQHFQFPNIASNPFIALRKNVEIGFLASNLTGWEQEAVFQYGKKHIYHEYYSIILNLAKTAIVPRKVLDYACPIVYGHIFSPRYHKNMIYSFFVNFFAKPIFKNFNSGQASLEQEIVAFISGYFRKQNRYGPEQISVAILEEQFITIMISGLLSPFLRSFIQADSQESAVIEKIFMIQAEMVLGELLHKYFHAELEEGEPFIFFDKATDKLIILSPLSSQQWSAFLDNMNA